VLNRLEFRFIYCSLFTLLRRSIEISFFLKKVDQEFFVGKIFLF